MHMATWPVDWRGAARAVITLSSGTDTYSLTRFRQSSTVPSMSPSSEKLRVLIVDDQALVRDTIATMLSKRGYDTLTAESGDAALARLRTEYFDVVLLDVKMPGKSGLEILSESLLLDRDLPVLMLTGAGDIATARDALSRGAMDFLTKPIELDELDQAVRSAGTDRRARLAQSEAEQHTLQDAVLSTKELELHGGPLDGRTVHLHDSRLRLWVGLRQDGEQVLGSGESQSALPVGSRVLGSYGLVSGDLTLVWTPNG
jgi:DNA-binding response OmpR family regulator